MYFQLTFFNFLFYQKIDFKIATKIWDKSKVDFLSWSGCIIACMAAGVEIGLILGILLSVFNIFLKAARPKLLIYVEKSQMYGERIYAKPSSGIFFPGIDHLREQINIALIQTDFKYPVVIDLAKISSIDYTSLKGFEAIVNDLKKFNLNVNFINAEENLERRLCIK
jgi:MFS superfamily sulfate permease-like transporter